MYVSCVSVCLVRIGTCPCVWTDPICPSLGTLIDFKGHKQLLSLTTETQPTRFREVTPSHLHKTHSLTINSPNNISFLTIIIYFYDSNRLTSQSTSVPSSSLRFNVYPVKPTVNAIVIQQGLLVFTGHYTSICVSWIKIWSLCRDPTYKIFRHSKFTRIVMWFTWTIFDLVIIYSSHKFIYKTLLYPFGYHVNYLKERSLNI